MERDRKVGQVVTSLVMSFTRFPPVPFPAGGGPEGVGNGEGNER